MEPAQHQHERREGCRRERDREPGEAGQRLPRARRAARGSRRPRARRSTQTLRPALDEEQRERHREPDREHHPRAQERDEPPELVADVGEIAVPEHRPDDRRPGDREHAGSGAGRDEREPGRRDDVPRDPGRRRARSGRAARR